MNKLIVLSFFVITFYSCAQNNIELKYDEKFESKFVASYQHENSLYIINYEKAEPDIAFYSLYRIDLDSRKILNKVKVKEENIYSDPYFKTVNDSLYIINRHTFEDFAHYYIFTVDLHKQNIVKTYSIDNYIQLQKIPLFTDKNNEIYIDGKTIKKESGYSYLSLEDKSVYFFAPSYKTRDISFSKVSLKDSFRKSYTLKELPNYENDFVQYSKFRDNTNFLPSGNFIFITPDVMGKPINLESFYYLKFNKANGNLVKIGIPKIENLIDCDKVKTLSKFQYEMSSSEKHNLIQFGIDKDENFCICQSKSIGVNFSYQEIKSYNQSKVYIGTDSKAKTTKIYFN